MFFIASGILIILTIGGTAIGRWSNALGDWKTDRIHSYIEISQNGLLIGISLFLIFGWCLYSRQRIVSYPSGNVWVRNGGCGVTQFKWDEVARWKLDVLQISTDEGMEESPVIVVGMASGREIRITDSHNKFVCAFLEHVPSLEFAEQCVAPKTRK